jgi:hypothetical protein
MDFVKGCNAGISQEVDRAGAEVSLGLEGKGCRVAHGLVV